ncbi:hypothetical protein R3P38DRAFT_3177670 [Favolaschia claudopus]|uniref:Uncharacterized protein n=1 Tax=Favolaschia claudopus TaxID=2862362 RepID=A0AAW0CX54_9AGAR
MHDAARPQSCMLGDDLRIPWYAFAAYRQIPLWPDRRIAHVKLSLKADGQPHPIRLIKGPRHSRGTTHALGLQNSDDRRTYIPISPPRLHASHLS